MCPTNVFFESLESRLVLSTGVSLSPFGDLLVQNVQYLWASGDANHVNLRVDGKTLHFTGMFRSINFDLAGASAYASVQMKGTSLPPCTVSECGNGPARVIVDYSGQLAVSLGDGANTVLDWTKDAGGNLHYFQAGDGANTIMVYYHVDTDISVGNGNNVLYGGTSFNTFDVGNGNNYVNAVAGNSFVGIGSGKNTIFGGQAGLTVDLQNQTLSSHDFIVWEGGKNLNTLAHPQSVVLNSVHVKCVGQFCQYLIPD